MLRPKRHQIPNLHLRAPLHQRPQELSSLTKPHRVKPILQLLYTLQRLANLLDILVDFSKNTPVAVACFILAEGDEVDVDPGEGVFEGGLEVGEIGGEGGVA